ncbi:MAG: NAD(P)(+) transhydrogenase (Re/Si-specific) subunit alpha, partial [Pseudomonadota bacterium]
QLGETVVVNGVKIIGPKNVPSTVASHASQMYGKNIENLLAHLVDDEGNLNLDYEDEIIRETVVSLEGNVPQVRMRELLGMPELPVKESADEAADA